MLPKVASGSSAQSINIGSTVLAGMKNSVWGMVKDLPIWYIPHWIFYAIGGAIGAYVAFWIWSKFIR